VFQDAASGVEVRTLSPSSKTVTTAATAFGNLLPKSGSLIKRVTEDGPNDVSVVLLVRSPAVSFLLGADLERTDDPQCGWRAVITSGVRPRVKSIGFKVAHHGSENGDLDEIWSELLEVSPYSLVTPYGRGRKPLPSPPDVGRLLKRTPQAYCTVWPLNVRPRVRDKAANRTMDEVAKNRRSVRRTPGHLRLRVPLANAAVPVLSMFDGAVALRQPKKKGKRR
jgi:hypothetical protein